MEDLFHVRPPLAGRTALKRTLHGPHDLPPFLSVLVGSHFCHVGFEVHTVIFKVPEQQIILQVNGVIVNVAFANRAQNRGPNFRMIFPVFLYRFRPDSNH